MLVGVRVCMYACAHMGVWMGVGASDVTLPVVPWSTVCCKLKLTCPHPDSQPCKLALSGMRARMRGPRNPFMHNARMLAHRPHPAKQCLVSCTMHNAQCTMHVCLLTVPTLQDNVWFHAQCTMHNARTLAHRPHLARQCLVSCTMHNAQCTMHNARMLAHRPHPARQCLGHAGGIGGKQPPRSYEVDDRDFFWETCGAYPFPKVAEVRGP